MRSVIFMIVWFLFAFINTVLICFFCSLQLSTKAYFISSINKNQSIVFVFVLGPQNFFSVFCML